MKKEMKKIIFIIFFIGLIGCKDTTHTILPKPDLVEFKVLSYEKSNKNPDCIWIKHTYAYHYSIKVMDKDSIVYYYYTDTKYDIGDKIKLPFRDGDIVYPK